jgi:hypothetical protein
MNKNISELEEIFDTYSIEMFISDLADERLYLDIILADKPWEKNEEQ